MTASPLTILRLDAENILRLSAVSIAPDGSPVVVIGGDNEQGKSSVLAAIELALGGEKRSPPEPIRRGATEARVVLDLGDIIVTRKWNASGSRLEVTNREGAKYPSPQALLDGLVNKLTFDPLAFASSDEKAQAELLRRLAGVNTDDLDEAHRQTYDERTLVNRDLKQLEGALARTFHFTEAGLEERSTGEIGAQLDAAQALVQAAADAQFQAKSADATLSQAREKARTAAARVEQLRQALDEAEVDVEMADEAVLAAERATTEAQQRHAAAQQAVPDRSALQQQLAEIEETNAKVRVNQQRHQLAEQVEAKKLQSADLTSHLQALETQKAERLAAAQFPVEGLGLAPEGTVTWQGLPLAQAATSVRIRVSCAIGFALNPRLKILRVTSGNDLGAKNLHLLAKEAAKVGGQIWCERIVGSSGADGCFTVMIEDGHVAPAHETAGAQ